MTSKNGVNRNLRSTGKKQSGKKGFFRELLTDSSMGEIDYTFLTIVAGVLAAGLIMMLSASAPRAASMYGNSYYFFFRQFAFAAAGVVAMLIISRIDYKFYRK